MEKTEMATTSSQSHKDEPKLETPLSQDIDHNVERVKDMTTKLQQLIVRFEPYTKPVEGTNDVMIIQSPGEMKVHHFGTGPGEPVIELGKFSGKYKELNDEQRSILTKAKQVLRFGAAVTTLEVLKRMAKGLKSFSKMEQHMNLDALKRNLEGLKKADGFRTENDALDTELSNLKSAILLLLDDVRENVQIYSALKVEADKFVSKVKESMEAAGFQCKDGQSIHEMEEIRDAKFLSERMESLEPRGPKGQGEMKMEQIRDAKFLSELMESLEPRGPKGQGEMKMEQGKDESTSEKLVQEFVDVCTQLLEEFERI